MKKLAYQHYNSCFQEVFWAKYSRNQKKQKIPKRLFRKKGLKCRRGGPRPKFLVSRSILSKVCQKKISRSGAQKIDDLGPIFKNECPKVRPVRKKRVFCVADFFEKSRKWGFIFGGAPQNFFYKNL